MVKIAFDEVTKEYPGASKPAVAGQLAPSARFATRVFTQSPLISTCNSPIYRGLLAHGIPSLQKVAAEEGEHDA